MAIDRDEQQCVDIVLANHPGDEWVYTNERYSYLDGLFVRGGVIKAVAEIKTRECKFGTYRKELMTWNKMESGQWAAKSFKCPFYLFSYHPLSDLVAAYQITDTEGNFIRKYQVGDYVGNRTKHDRTQVSRKTVWVENNNPSILERCGRRCIY